MHGAAEGLKAINRAAKTVSLARRSDVGGEAAGVGELAGACVPPRFSDFSDAHSHHIHPDHIIHQIITPDGTGSLLPKRPLRSCSRWVVGGSTQDVAGCYLASNGVRAGGQGQRACLSCQSSRPELTDHDFDAHAFTVIIFGATGDLAREALSALYKLCAQGWLPRHLNIVG